ncbi:vacuolar membrane protein Pep3p [Monosporozyma servazzii]
MNVEFEEVSLDFVALTQKNHVASLQVSKNIFTVITKKGQLYVIDLDRPEHVGQHQLDLCTTNDNGELILKSWISPNAQTLLCKTNFNKYHLIQIPSLLSSPQGQITVKNLPQGRGKNINDMKLVYWIDDDQLLCTTVNNEVYWVNVKDCSVKLILSQQSGTIDGISYSPNKNLLLMVINESIMYWSLSLGKELLQLEKKFNHPIQIEQFDRFNGNTYIKKRFHSNSLNQFLWITATGIIYGDLNKESKQLLNEVNVVLTVEFPTSIDYNSIKDAVILDHLIILLLNENNNILVINKLNNKIVLNEKIDTPYPITNITLDNIQNTLWLNSSLTIFEVILQGQSNILWDLLCQQNRYQEALQLEGLHQWQKDLIHYRMGTHYLKNTENLEEGAKQLAISNSLSVSSNILQISDLKTPTSINNDDVLQTYLLTKLKYLLSKDPQDQFYKVQICLITNWIVRNYVKTLNSLIDTQIDYLSEKPNEIKQLENKLLSFCESNVSHLDFNTIYQIVSNYEKSNHLMISIATLNNDWVFILRYWIQKENWYESLKVLNNINDLSIIYQYSSILMVNCPELTIQKWMQLEKQIDPIKLIPTLLTFFSLYQKNSPQRDPKVNVGLTYLQWYINKYNPKDKIFYNTVLYMLICDKSSNDSTEDNVIECLNRYGTKYDINFILRLSLKLQRKKISIHLMTKLDLYENAISLALESNFIDLAKKILNEIDDKILKKKLFLQLSQRLLIDVTTVNTLGPEGNNDIKSVIRSILIDSDGLIQIKDLLPIFNDMITMGTIKDEILESLENYNESMTNMNKEIKNSIKLKQIITGQMKAFNERYEMLEPSDSCDSCHKLLTIRKFVVFPCDHCFHCDCLIKMIYNSNDIVLKNQIEALQRKILNNKKNQELLVKLEELMTTKCCLCSDITINTIDESLDIAPAQSEKWAL